MVGTSFGFVVDLHRADLQLCGDGVSLVEIIGEDGGLQAILGAVGNFNGLAGGGDPDDGQDRAEGLDPGDVVTRSRSVG